MAARDGRIEGSGVWLCCQNGPGRLPWYSGDWTRPIWSSRRLIVADNKLIGRDYSTPDLVAKVTGKAKYAEDYRVDGMLFARLLLSPMPHARVRRIDTSAALAMPGVKGILTADDLPA